MKEFCENQYCESPGFKEVPVPVRRPGDQRRTLCAACEEVYTWGVRHGTMTAGQSPMIIVVSLTGASSPMPPGWGLLLHLVARLLEVEDVGPAEGELAVVVERANLALGDQCAQFGRRHARSDERRRPRRRGPIDPLPVRTRAEVWSAVA